MLHRVLHREFFIESSSLRILSRTLLNLKKFSGLFREFCSIRKRFSVRNNNQFILHLVRLLLVVDLFVCSWNFSLGTLVRNISPRTSYKSKDEVYSCVSRGSSALGTSESNLLFSLKFSGYLGRSSHAMKPAGVFSKDSLHSQTTRTKDVSPKFCTISVR